jgi:hypothetical protein
LNDIEFDSKEIDISGRLADIEEFIKKGSNKENSLHKLQFDFFRGISKSIGN